MQNLQHLPPQERAWLAALAGQPSQTDDEEPAVRQARQLRHYFAQRDALEAAAPLGPSSEARMLARMHRLGALNTSPATAAAAAPALGQRLLAALDWLLPSGPGAGARYALVAGVALAVMVVPVLIRQPQQPQDGGYKSGPALGSGAQLMLVAQPVQQLQQLQAALQAAGVAAQAQAHERGYQLQASVPPAQRAAVQNALQPWGLVVPPYGRLVVNIQPAPMP